MLKNAYLCRQIIFSMEVLKHECGVAMIRLLKPLEYYEQKYGTWMYGLNKLYLLMEKQHNRGQEGAGVACVELESKPGEEYMFRVKAAGSGAISEIFGKIQQNFKGLSDKQLHDVELAKRSLPFAGELYMGHLRYSTTGKSGLTYVHPVMRRHNWRAQNLALCGNFNLTNVDEVFHHITSQGQHPRQYSDTYIILEQLGHRLDREVERLFSIAKEQGLHELEITKYIEKHINMANVLRQASPIWDGGYVMCGLTGSGELFSLRDPWGIRPAFWYADDEVVVLASERPVIQTAFNLKADAIVELKPGEALLVNQSGEIRCEQINAPKQVKACSFERIYFSRGSDRDIYLERKSLGKQLVPTILKAINYDIDHTVFSFIPNTAEVAFYGMLEGLDDYLNQEKIQELKALGHSPSEAEWQHILSRRIRHEKVAIKDIKLRTFITEGNSRNDLAAHVYDITYGSIKPGVDNLVIIDDSIVRGTTLKQSIIGILDRLEPKKIIIVSSSPQVRYPDYYGIDMSHMTEFIAFRSAIALLKDRGMGYVIREVYQRCKQQLLMDKEQMQNPVKEIYALFSDEEISRKMVELLKPADTHAEVQMVFQPLEGLHKACPNHLGDWCFSGNYPTPGGLKLLNMAFIEYVEQTDSILLL